MNVTPDKRLVLIQNEKFLLAILKESLLSVFQNVPCTLVVQNVGLIKNQSGVEEKTKCLEIIEKIKSKARKSEAQERQNLGENNKNFVCYRFLLYKFSCINNFLL